MTPEDRVVLTCSHPFFEESDEREVERLCLSCRIDWSQAYRIAKTHGVAPLVYSNLRECDPVLLGIPDSVSRRMEAYSLQNLLIKSKIRKRLEEVLCFLQEQSVDALLLKGAALDLTVYRNPWLTSPCDVDLAIRFRKKEVTSEDRDRIDSFFRCYPGFEYDYFEHHDVTMNGVLPVDFNQVWDESQAIRLAGVKTSVMGPEDLLISLCINSCRKRFFRLKSLCDIAAVLHRYSTLGWHKVYRKARQYGCLNIVYAALLVAQMTLHCEVITPRVLEACGVSSVRKSLIRGVSQSLCRLTLNSIYAGKRVMGRSASVSLILPYSTLTLGQVLRKLRYVLQTSLRSIG
jgi:hypothetical protein